MTAVISWRRRSVSYLHLKLSTRINPAKRFANHRLTHLMKPLIVCCVLLQVYNFVANHLKFDGVALIAGKRYYFGTEGGTSVFYNLVKSKAEEKSENYIYCEQVFVFEDGLSNLREIIMLKRKR